MNSLNGEYTRTEEALLAAAGLDASHPHHADYKLVKRADGRWEICSLSPRGYEWVRSRMNEPLQPGTDTTIAVNLFEANRFLKEARANGFKTEFVGLNGLDYF
jgi:hypothetical protein